MELELKKETLKYYELRARTSEMHEETIETIVPDYCPDISRILCSDGTVSTDSCELAGGKATVSGSVQVCVLYLPDGDSGVRALPISVPFSIVAENREWENCERVFADVKMISAESRCLNPRKVFTRVIVCATICAAAAVTAEICGGTEGEMRVEKKMRTDTMCHVSAVAEKEFTYVDEIGISPGKEPIAELLHWSARTSVQEAKRIGAKLVIKGVLHADFLYRSEEGTLCTASEEMRLSQIMEMNEGGEDALISARLFVCGMEMHTGGESDPSSRHVITAKFRLKARAVLRETRNITYLCDAYSTAYDLSAETSPLKYTKLSEQSVRRQTVREIIEAGTAVKNVLYCGVDCGEVSMDRSGDGIDMKAPLNIHIIFIDENDAPSSVERRAEAACHMEAAENLSCAAEAECSDEIFTSAGSGGIEVRIPVDFTVTAEDVRRELCISRITVDTDTPKDLSRLPSVVLRCPDKDETLWDIAKRSCATVDGICAANDIKDQDAPLDGKLLLIPKKR